MDRACYHSSSNNTNMNLSTHDPNSSSTRNLSTHEPRGPLADAPDAEELEARKVQGGLVPLKDLERRRQRQEMMVSSSEFSFDATKDASTRSILSKEASVATTKSDAAKLRSSPPPLLIKDHDASSSALSLPDADELERPGRTISSDTVPTVTTLEDEAGITEYGTVSTDTAPTVTTTQDDADNNAKLSSGEPNEEELQHRSVDPRASMSFAEFGIYDINNVAKSQQDPYGMGSDAPPALAPSPEDVVPPSQDDAALPIIATRSELNPNKRRRQVHFEHVQVREHAVTIGDHPSCSRGVPISLDWEYSDERAMPIDLYETTNKRRRRKNARRMLLSPYQRRNLLWRCGYELEEIEEAAKTNEKQYVRQSVQLYLLPVHMLEEWYLHQRDRFQKSCGSQPNDRSREAEKRAIEAQVRSLHRIQLADTEKGVPWRRDTSERVPRPEPRRISFRRASSNIDITPPMGTDASVHSEGDNWDGMSDHSGSSRYSTTYSQASDISGCGSFDKKLQTYGIRTDPRQHDKATEIILCSVQRPHMRAFHGSWFGFFIGFVMWFAITPLLAEVKETLGLTNAEIWTSSMCGTAVTVLARVMMGPLCDVFGARRCMAAIIILAAIPCGLTGLVNNAMGLSVVRAFIGIAGSAFVPCQYWTSRMFAREVAGTANALAAGWGNLGGGVTQLLMGSALFPLFEIFFQDHDNSSELAWRTVFVVPALIAFMAAYIYIFHCDDSPKGDYTELVRQQQIELVSPFWSLSMAIQNRNVVLLLIQYACCFGVEITMTNATALYMKDEFGLDTVQAAAVASVFGFMNLFARGLGGYGSDYCNSRWGTTGRVVWQSITLFMEGAGIVVFAFCNTLIASIFALIFLSLWVQCSEGSTYGIVPYVNRRFTGAVVGWIGGGGTLGGVIFSFLFREYVYKQAFIIMGLAAAGSCFLSVFLDVESLNAIYHEKIKAEHIKNNNNFVFHDDAPIHDDTPTSFHDESEGRNVDV